MDYKSNKINEVGWIPLVVVIILVIPCTVSTYETRIAQAFEPQHNFYWNRLVRLKRASTSEYFNERNDQTNLPNILRPRIGFQNFLAGLSKTFQVLHTKIRESQLNYERPQGNSRYAAKPNHVITTASPIQLQLEGNVRVANTSVLRNKSFTRFQRQDSLSSSHQQAGNVQQERARLPDFGPNLSDLIYDVDENVEGVMENANKSVIFEEEISGAANSIATKQHSNVVTMPISTTASTTRSTQNNNNGFGGPASFPALDYVHEEYSKEDRPTILPSATVKSTSAATAKTNSTTSPTREPTANTSSSNTATGTETITAKAVVITTTAQPEKTTAEVSATAKPTGILTGVTPSNRLSTTTRPVRRLFPTSAPTASQRFGVLGDITRNFLKGSVGLGIFNDGAVKVASTASPVFAQGTRPATDSDQDEAGDDFGDLAPIPVFSEDDNDLPESYPIPTSQPSIAVAQAVVLTTKPTPTATNFAHVSLTTLAPISVTPTMAPVVYSPQSTSTDSSVAMKLPGNSFGPATLLPINPASSLADSFVTASSMQSKKIQGDMKTANFITAQQSFYQPQPAVQTSSSSVENFQSQSNQGSPLLPQANIPTLNLPADLHNLQRLLAGILYSIRGDRTESQKSPVFNINIGTINWNHGQNSHVIYNGKGSEFLPISSSNPISTVAVTKQNSHVDVPFDSVLPMPTQLVQSPISGDISETIFASAVPASQTPPTEKRAKTSTSTVEPEREITVVPTPPPKRTKAKPQDYPQANFSGPPEFLLPEEIDEDVPDDSNQEVQPVRTSSSMGTINANGTDAPLTFVNNNATEIIMNVDVRNINF